MRKFVLTLGTLGVVLSGGLAFTLYLIGSVFKASPVEPPEITQAKLTAQLEQLQRQQAEADFYSNLIKFGLLALVALVVIAGAITVWYFYSAANHSRRMEMARLKIEAGLLRADERGNYPVLVNRQTGDYTRPRPGNPAYPEQVHFVNGLQPQPLDRPGRGPVTRSLTTRAYGRPTAYYSSVEVVTPEQIEAPADSRKASASLQQQETSQPDSDRELQDLQGEVYGKFTDLLPQVEAAIREGRGKTETLKALGLGGRHYKEAGQLWEEVTNRLARKQS